MKNTKHCAGCLYHRPVTGMDRTEKQVMACHYCVDTGRLRGVPVEECTHYTQKRYKRRTFAPVGC